MPHDFHSSASETCMAKIAGCAISVRCICEVSSVRASSSSREKRAHGFIAAAQRSRVCAEDRLVAHQLAAHAPPLRALSAHHEGDARRRFAARSEGGADLRALLFHAETVEFLNQLGHRICDDGEPIRVVIAPRSERM